MKHAYRLLCLLLVSIFLFSLTSCNYDSVVLPPHQHKYTYQVYPSSCSVLGYIEYHCACRDSYKEPLTEYADHSFNTFYTTDIEPTYTTEGEQSFHCVNCNARTGITSIPKLETDLPFIPPT